MERWADEHAAVVTGDRQLAARAIARAALATAAAPAPRPAGDAGALGVLGTVRRLAPARRPGPVPRRVAALLRPPPQPRLLLLFAAVAIVLVSGASALEAARDLHALLALARDAGRS